MAADSQPMHQPLWSPIYGDNAYSAQVAVISGDIAIWERNVTKDKSWPTPGNFEKLEWP